MGSQLSTFLQQPPLPTCHYAVIINREAKL